MTSKRSSQTFTIVSPTNPRKNNSRGRPERRSDHFRLNIFQQTPFLKNRELNINNFVKDISFHPRKANCLKDKKKRKKKKKWARIKIPDV